MKRDILGLRKSMSEKHGKLLITHFYTVTEFQYTSTYVHALTVTDNPSILIMIAVVDTPTREGAVSYAGLATSALKVIHPDGSTPLTKGSITICSDSTTEVLHPGIDVGGEVEKGRRGKVKEEEERRGGKGRGGKGRGGKGDGGGWEDEDKE